MSISTIFMAMAKLFIILVIGYICEKAGIFPKETQNVLNKIVIYLGNPCIILYSVLASSSLPEPAVTLRILAAAVLAYAMMTALAWLAVKIFRVPLGTRGVFMCMLIFANCSFFGVPVTQTLFGDTAVFYLSVFNLPFVPLLFTMGYYVMMKDSAALAGTEQKLKISWRSFLLNPNLIMSVLAIVLSFVGCSFVPSFITETSGMIGNLCAPCALFAIGSSLAKQPARNMLGSSRVYALSALRLIVFPAAVWFVIHLFVKDPTILGVAVVALGMPVATMVGMLASEYKSDEQFCMQGIFISTVLSIITIPLLVTILA